MDILKISEIKSNPNNPRVIKDDKFKKLVQSIKDFPRMLELRPLVLDENNIVLGGNMRLKACISLGLKEVPVVYAKDLTEEQKKEFIIKDNVGFGEWDWDVLANEWESTQLNEWGLDVPEIEHIDPEVTEDDYEMPDEVKTDIVLGDLIEIGEHRLLCGDSTSIDAVEKLMNGEKADMVFTDPPYNTGMTAQTQSGNGGTLWKGNKKPNEKAWLSHMFNDSYTDEEWETFMQDFMVQYDYLMKDDSVAYICLDWRRSYELIPHIKAHFKLSNVIVWDKVVHGLGSDYKYTYELIHVCKKGKPELNTHQGDREYSDVWHIQRKMGKDEDHATKKPIELCERGIRHSSPQGALVCDLFLGSGSTMVASHQLKRKCYGMELDPKYCQVIVDRMKKLDPTLVIKRNGELWETLT